MAQIIGSCYEIIEKIGAGGGGNVFLANHLRLGKKVVLKADKKKLTTKREILRREVDVLKELSHTYIPQVYDFFVEDGTVYTVIDYVEGESLDKPLKRGERFSQAQIIAWAVQLLEALCYLHSPVHGSPPRGFVHGDIKPANIMRTPGNDIKLIDFNIALALGEENILGRSAGYASPEHYGLDFSTDETQRTAQKAGGRRKPAAGSDTDSDMTLTDHTLLETQQEKSSSSVIKTVVPDVRSDIYSLGATLYHLLSGNRPAKDAREVRPLSENECSLPVAAIITKAMNPNPELRYQTAEEMLAAFTHIREQDPRMRKLKRSRMIGSCIFAAALLAGVGMTFVGLKRMQLKEQCLKLAEYSQNALAEGNVSEATALALQAIPKKSGILEAPVTAKAQLALTDALGVYDLADGFKALDTLELPAAPLKTAISPEGSRLAVLYAWELAVFDLDSRQLIAALPIEKSALSDVIFVDESRVLYAGEQGITLYDLNAGKALWIGEAATTLALSGDKTMAAAVNRDDTYALLYRVSDGEKMAECSFWGQRLSVAANDIFADPQDDIFALNEDGTRLAVSFSEGGLTVFDLENPEEDLIFFEESAYTRFEGGFCGSFFAFAAEGSGQSIFRMSDIEEGAYAAGYDSRGTMHLQTDEQAIYLTDGDLLVKIDPDTLQETELAYAENRNITGFFAGKEYVLIATDDKGFSFFDRGANEISSEVCSENCDFVELSDRYAVVANRNEPSVRLLILEDHEESQLLSYDARYPHKEARISQDGETAMLFGYQGFQIYSMEGVLLKEEVLPDEEQIYDQQFIKSEDGSWLEVIWYDGTVRRYSAADGTLLSEEKKEAPGKDLEEEFYTLRYRIVSSLHEAPKVYDLKSGRQVAELEQESYLTYVTQLGDEILTEYISASGERYGLLLNEKLETLAYLPQLCDIAGQMAVFDDGAGNMRQCRLYSLRELVALGEMQ